MQVFIDVDIVSIFIYVSQFQIIKHFKLIIDMGKFAVTYFVYLKAYSE